MSAVGRLLRTMRHAAARSVEEIGAAAGIPGGRLLRLERGTAELEYLEGIRLARALDLCPNCFRRLLETAAERDAYAGSMAAGGGPPEGELRSDGEGAAPAGPSGGR